MPERTIQVETTEAHDRQVAEHLRDGFRVEHQSAKSTVLAKRNFWGTVTRTTLRKVTIRKVSQSSASSGEKPPAETRTTIRKVSQSSASSGEKPPAETRTTIRKVSQSSASSGEKPPAETPRFLNQSDSPSASAGGWVHAVRLMAGAATIVALAIILISAIQTIEDGRAFDISAVQVIQVYAEHIFYATVAIGGLIGVYVMTRLSP